VRRAFTLAATLGRGGWLPAGAAYAALAVLWAAPSALAPFDSVPNYGDPLHLGWVMAWDAHQLVRAPWALFDSNSFHPYPRSLAFGDHLLPEALLVAPLFWATRNAVLAYNAAVAIALTLSALAMFALVRCVAGRADAAFLAGLAYAFNAFTQSELPRVQVVNLQWWPLALLFLGRFAREGRARDARCFAGAFVLQGLSGSYYLLYGALLLPLWLLAAATAAGRRPALADLRHLVSSFAVAGAVAMSEEGRDLRQVPRVWI
jgi:hypothetical protein